MSVLSLLNTASTLAGLPSRSADRLSNPFANQTNATLGRLADSGITLSEDSVKEIEDTVEISQHLQRAVDQMKDDSRSNKASEIKQKIEELKQRLQFATPKQAKAMLRELKALAQDFKGAASQLGADAAELSSGTSGVSMSQAQGAAASDDATGPTASGEAQGTAQPGEPQETEAAGTASNGAKPFGEPGEESDANATGKSDDEPSQEELKSALQAYIGAQHKEEEAANRSRAVGMKKEREDLKTLGEELKQLAKRIADLARRDRTDETESRRDKSSIDQAVNDAKQALNSPELTRSLDLALSEGPGSARAQVSGAATVAPAQASLAYTAGVGVPALASPQAVFL